MSKFQSDPRDFALELAENGLVSAEHLLLCCLKYMSHDDVRGMLEANELAPDTCDECDCEVDDGNEYCDECKTEIELELYLSEHPADSYDVEGMRSDIENNNLEVGDDASEYEHSAIVQTSLMNGQFTQAKKQCEAFNLDYDSELLEFKGSDNE